MDLTLKNEIGIEPPANFLAQSILRQLGSGKKVLWFATGGSSIAVCIEAAKIISAHPHHGLTVTLTDERYGDLTHPDSNWNQLIQGGFDLPEAKMVPVLDGDEAIATTEKFNTILGEELGKADFKIGLFGIGADGHTAGILPESVAVHAPDWACTYKSEKFERITITPRTILALDEAVVFMKGQEKWPVVRELQEENIDILKQPAQILKKVPLLTLFSDYQKI